MTSGTAHLVDERIAHTEVVKALVLLLSLHDTADAVQLRADMLDGRVTRCDVEYLSRGRPLGGFSS